MATDHVDVCLADDAHAEIVEGPCQETSERGEEGDGSITTGSPDSDTHQVLLADETLDIPTRIDLDTIGSQQHFSSNKNISLRSTSFIL